MARRRLAGRARHRGARARQAARRGAARRGVRRAGRRPRRRARGRGALRGDRGAAPGVHLAGRAARGAHRGGLRRARCLAAVLAGRAADAVRAAARRGRPAAAQAGRLRGARAARRRPVRRDDLADGGGRDPRLPGGRVRAGQARAPAGPAVRADRPARRGHQVRRRRGAGAAPARRRGLGQDQGPGAQGGPRDRRRADPAVLGADGLARARVRAGHAVAARA